MSSTRIGVVVKINGVVTDPDTLSSIVLDRPGINEVIASYLKRCQAVEAAANEAIAEG